MQKLINFLKNLKIIVFFFLWLPLWVRIILIITLLIVLWYFFIFLREIGVFSGFKNPYIGIHVSHNIVNDEIAKQSGFVEYDILMERPISETNIIKNLFITFTFPTPIKRFEIVNSIGTDNFTIKEGNKTFFLIENNQQTSYSNQLVMEDGILKPGCFIRVKAFSPDIQNRLGVDKIVCSGYYNYNVSDIILRKNVSLTFQPRFQKIMEMDAKKWQMLQEMIQKIESKEGSLVFWTSDKNWLDRNNATIDFIPYIKKDDFSLRIFRDKDHLFKCEIANLSYPKIILKYGNLEKIKQSKSHPKHMITLTWKNREKKLYIDAELVDSFPK
ncbi:MAG: hypothetical protein V1749_11040 [Candidatus Desantisbacteria bacterium]